MVSDRRSHNDVSFYAPLSATWAAAHLRKELPYFCGGGVGKKILLKAPPVAKQEIRRPVVNDVSRQKVERGVDVTEAFAVDQPIFALSAGAFGLVEKSPEVLARCLAIPRLVSAADDDVQAGPTPLATIVAPPSEERVQLFELDAHGQLRSLERVGGEGADVFLESLKSTTPSARTLSTSVRARHNSSAGPFHCWGGGRTSRRGVDGGLRFPNLCALCMKFARGQLGEAATSVGHERELDAGREVGERLELMVADWYDLPHSSPQRVRPAADSN